MGNLYGWSDLPGEFGVVCRQYPPGDVRRYGASWEDADSSVAIQTAIDNAALLNIRAVAMGVYNCQSQVVFRSHADFGAAIFNMPGTLPVCVDVSGGIQPDGTLGRLFDKSILLPDVLNTTKPPVGWAGQGIGVRLANIYSCHIQMGKVRNFGIGLQAAAYNNGGNVHSKVFINHLENNHVNFDADCDDGDESHVNEITFIGGRLSFYSGQPMAGTRHIRINSVKTTINNLVFDHPSIEGDPEIHVESAGSYCDIYNARWESSHPRVHYFGTSINQGTRNRIFGGCDSDFIVFTHAGITGGNNHHIGYAVENRTLSGNGARLRNQSSNGSPVFTLYNTGVVPELAGPNDWTVQMCAAFYKAKGQADIEPRITIDSYTGRIYIGNGQTAPTNWFGSYNGSLLTNATIYPNADGTQNQGSANYRWGTAFYANAPVVTSDRREKSDIAPIDDAVLRAWARVNYVSFRLKDSVAQKGSRARLHVGVIAQEVEAAFKAEGLDPFAYGVLCYDEWGDRAEQRDADGNIIQEARGAGNRYGVRYDQALVLEAALMRHRMDNLEAALTARP